MHPLALVGLGSAFGVRALIAFDRETTTIAALWSMIVASAVFVLGAAVIYRRERRAARRVPDAPRPTPTSSPDGDAAVEDVALIGIDGSDAAQPHPSPASEVEPSDPD